MRISAALARTAAGELRVVSAFRKRRAVTLRAAKSLAELGLNNSPVLQTMVAETILRRAGPERYFLDEGVWAQRRSMSGKNLWRLVLGFGFGLAAIAYYFFG